MLVGQDICAQAEAGELHNMSPVVTCTDGMSVMRVCRWRQMRSA